MKLIKALLMSAGLMAISFDASAATGITLGQMATYATTSIQNVGQFAGALGYAIAFFFLLGAIFKLKQHGEDPERHTLRAPAFLFVCAVLLAYMTTVLASGNQTLFGGAGQTQGSDGSGFRNL